MSVTSPAGFRAAGVTAGLKVSGRPDLALVVNDGPLQVAAGVFTTNRVVAAPVVWSRQAVSDGVASAVVLNSGGANACTGPDGFADTHRTAEHVATVLASTLTTVQWTCVASPGGACAASGTGSIEMDVDLAPGGTVTFTISALVASDATGTLESSATVTAPPSYEDPDTTDNTATDIDIVAITDRIFADGFDPP